MYLVEKVVGYLFTDTVKCITLMMLVGLVGKSGRSFMRALLFSLILGGDK